MPSFNINAQRPQSSLGSRELTRRSALTLGGLFLLNACGAVKTDQKQTASSESSAPSASATPSTSAIPSPTPSPTFQPALNAAEQEELSTTLRALFADGAYPQYSLLVTGLDGTLTNTGANTAPVDLYNVEADTARVPASTFKILTFFTLSRHANLLQARLRTRVLRSEAGLYLVAGGDTLLSAGASNPKQVMGRAGLATLAEQTVKALSTGKKPSGELPVHLDTTMFTGPAVNAGWEETDVTSGQITAIHPIALESHTVPGESTPSNPVRPEDAAVAAQQALVTALNAAGKEANLSFTLAKRATAPAEASEVAAVESATLLEQAQHMMFESDNALAEVLGRYAAIASGAAGSAEAAQKTIHRTLVDAGVNVEKLEQADVCGMSLMNRVTARTLVQTVALLNADKRAAQLMGVFPVAGVSGTLAHRFESATSVDARGFVRAKTGTLYTVSSLCGVATRPDGTRLLFALILNDLNGAEVLPAAKEHADAVAAAIANRLGTPSATPTPSASTSASATPKPIVPSVSPEPTTTPEPTATPKPSVSPEPTATPKPSKSATPDPSTKPTHSPKPTPEETLPSKSAPAHHIRFGSSSEG